ncbi:hypothetical protein SCOR_33450 [Sulfidibacter corallicola]|uniref:N-acetyltransferase domain-containing protein n=1 Tax=Sulfidibacter corallicola TaxID=2818388 RepID=A0A8A4TL24_SULCO|nr:GNAT family N-acetyltransferase [Sulfidibacter corallicola]QTD49558.1 hypothetical protein J3U87_28560 [Sulfidibacter corallicola]
MPKPTAPSSNAADTDPHEIRVFTKQFLAQTAEVVTRCFLNHEAMTASQRVPEPFFFQFVSSLLRRSHEDGLSMIALDRHDGHVAAVLINEDWAIGPPEMDWDPVFLPIITLLDKLGQTYSKDLDMRPGFYFHLFMLAVDAPFKGRRLGDRLVGESLELARSKGFKKAVVEATGGASQYICRNLHGFEERHRINYKEFRYRDSPIFSGIRGEECTILMDRTL